MPSSSPSSAGSSLPTDALGRRRFLKGLGACLALPVLNSAITRGARAAAAATTTAPLGTAEAAAPLVMNSERWIVLLIGLLVSFIVALGVVEWFLQWVRKHGFAMFAIYRILVGAALLIWGTKYLAG